MGLLVRHTLVAVACAALLAPPAAAQARDGRPSSADTSVAAQRGRAEALYWDAYSAYQFGTPDSLDHAIDLWRQAADAFRQLGDERNLESVFRQLASAFRQLGRSDSAQAYVRLASRANELIRGRMTDRPLLGIVLGAALLTARLPGEISTPLGSGIGSEVQVRYGLPAGFAIAAGGMIASHSIQGRTDAASVYTEQLRARYTLRSVFLEPRWTAYTGRFYSPFVTARVGFSWETVNGSGARFNGAGVVMGAGVGLQLRVHPQLALEGGARFQRMAFGDFSFSGEAEVDGCLQPLRTAGVPLPTAVEQCAGLRDYAQTTLCDFQGSITGTGCRPTTLHPQSRRRMSSTGFWIGFTVILAPR